jgi:hypothetical protein
MIWNQKTFESKKIKSVSFNFKSIFEICFQDLNSNVNPNNREKENFTSSLLLGFANPMKNIYAAITRL